MHGYPDNTYLRMYFVFVGRTISVEYGTYVTYVQPMFLHVSRPFIYGPTFRLIPKHVGQ